eukprot:2945536-Amphidinium_carterae.1
MSLRLSVGGNDNAAAVQSTPGFRFNTIRKCMFPHLSKLRSFSKAIGTPTDIAYRAVLWHSCGSGGYLKLRLGMDVHL